MTEGRAPSGGTKSPIVTDETASDVMGMPPAARDILSRRLVLNAADRWLLRLMALVARRQVRAITGLRHIAPENDPFILAMNHSIRREAVLVPVMLFLHRDGRLIHFLSDWNNRLIPGVGFLLARGGTITVTRKPARPAFLNTLRPFFRHQLPSLERARRHLVAGRSVGIFPEGTVNRDPSRLKAPRPGMARLALETGVPVVPVGIRFPDARPGEAPDEHAAMAVHIGAPVAPPASEGRAAPSAVRGFNATIMHEIARLSGKEWQPPT